MAINWSATGVDDITQCVSTLLATAPGTVPLSRAMGTPQDVVDQPMSRAGALLQAAVVTAIRTYEPRAKVTSVTLTGDADGRLAVKVSLGAP